MPETKVLEVDEEEEEEIEEDLDEGGEEEEDLEDDSEDGGESSSGSPFGVWSPQTVGEKRLKVLLYGVSGVGKTTFAASFPKPLFLDLESGMMSTLRVGEVMRYPSDPNRDITSYSQVKEFYNLVRKDCNPQYQTIVIDSVNELQVLVAQNVVAKYDRVKRQYDDQLTLADYQKANSDVVKVVRAFIKLPFNVVFTATSTRMEPGEDGVMLTPKLVGKVVGPTLEKLMDLIGYCYAKPTKDGGSEHYASFHITPRYLAKDRLGIVSRDIPNTYEALIGSTGGSKHGA